MCGRSGFERFMRLSDETTWSSVMDGLTAFDLVRFSTPISLTVGKVGEASRRRHLRGRRRSMMQLMAAWIMASPFG